MTSIRLKQHPVLKQKHYWHDVNIKFHHLINAYILYTMVTLTDMTLDATDFLHSNEISDKGSPCVKETKAFVGVVYKKSFLYLWKKNNHSLSFQGDGLEFKRYFVKIKLKLHDIISPQKFPWSASSEPTRLWPSVRGSKDVVLLCWCF